jgi:hypothetical protein
MQNKEKVQKDNASEKSNGANGNSNQRGSNDQHKQSSPTDQNKQNQAGKEATTPVNRVLLKIRATGKTRMTVK